MNTFKPGQTLSAHSICDYECIYTGRVIKRTDKTVTIDTPMKGVKRCKIHQSDHEEGEFIYPFGRYSMAPIFRAVA